MSGRGSRGRLGAVKIKVERVVHNQERRGNDGVYEDEVVYVTERPAKRGRPKKPTNMMSSATSRPTPQLPLQRYPQSVISNEVILLTRGGRARHQYVIPSRSSVQHSIVHQQQQLSGILSPRQFTVCSPGCPHAVRLLSVGQTATNVVKPILTLDTSKVPKEGTKLNLSNDLQQLVNSWDSLPETRTREMVKWLQTPSSKSQQPSIVREIQDMWASMPESWEEKVDLALEWLQDGELQKTPTAQPSFNPALPSTPVSLLRRVTLPSNSVTFSSSSVTLSSNNVFRQSNNITTASNCDVTPLGSAALLPTSRAKVLVEAQPIPIQDSSQWSSMADNRDDTNH